MMQKFETIIKKVIKWKKNYNSKNDIFDGYGWEIKYTFRNFDVHTKGYEAYPRNFKRVVRCLQKIIEELCSKYAYNYVIEDAQPRLLL